MVRTDETCFTAPYPGNGSGMFWSHGSAQIMRYGERIFATGYEVGKDAPLYSNTRWQLWCRDADGWRLAQSGRDFEEREPCVLALLPRGRIMMFINPAHKPVKMCALCTPQLLEVSADEPERPPRQILPPWPDRPRPVFIDHSYRGIAADEAAGELFLITQDVFTIKYGNWPYCWSFMDADGKWAGCGRIHFPTRPAYPQIAVRQRAAHVLGIEDIWEPNAKWHASKLKSNPRCDTWDYIFRRLYYAWAPDVTRGRFAPTLEIDSVKDTAGHIRNQDLWIGPDGAAHIIYRKTNISSAALRDEFFPGTPIVTTMDYVIVKDGAVVRRRELFRSGENDKEPCPGSACFHGLPDGRLLILCAMASRDGQNRMSNFWLELDARYAPTGRRVPLKLKEPLSGFNPANERAGVPASATIDILSRGREPDSVRYVRAVVPAKHPRSRKTKA